MTEENFFSNSEQLSTYILQVKVIADSAAIVVSAVFLNMAGLFKLFQFCVNVLYKLLEPQFLGYSMQQIKRETQSETKKVKDHFSIVRPKIFLTMYLFLSLRAVFICAST